MDGRSCFLLPLVIVSVVPLASGQMSNLENFVLSKASNMGLNAEDPFIEGIIRNALEAFRKLIRRGDPTRRIPSFDPLYIPKMTLVENETGGNIQTNLALYNSTLEGLSNFKIDRISGDLFQLSAYVDLSFPLIFMKGAYSLKFALFTNLLSINGHGPYNVKLVNVRLQTFWEFDIPTDTLHIETASINFDIDNSELNFRNLDFGQEILPFIYPILKNQVFNLADSAGLQDIIQSLQTYVYGV